MSGPHTRKSYSQTRRWWVTRGSVRLELKGWALLLTQNVCIAMVSGNAPEHLK